jgi:hypothetical protein
VGRFLPVESTDAHRHGWRWQEPARRKPNGADGPLGAKTEILKPNHPRHESRDHPSQYIAEFLVIVLPQIAPDLADQMVRSADERRVYNLHNVAREKKLPGQNRSSALSTRLERSDK